MHRYFCRPSVRVIRTLLEQKSPKDFFFAKYTQTRINRAENKAAFSFLPAHVILWMDTDGQRESLAGHRRKAGTCQENNVTAWSKPLRLPRWGTRPSIGVPGTVCRVRFRRAAHQGGGLAEPRDLYVIVL